MQLTKLEARVARLEGIVEAAVWLLLALPVAYVLVKVQRPEGFWASQIFNLAHVFVSGAVALVAYRLSRRVLGELVQQPWVHPFLAFIVVATVGGSLELVQFYAPGYPSLKDFVLDILGGLAALCVAISFDAHLFPKVSASSLQRWTLRAAAIFLVCLTLVPITRTSIQSAARASQFPLFADFERDVESWVLTAENGATLTRVPPPAGFTHARGEFVGKVDFAPGGSPKLEVGRLGGDWSKYGRLTFEVFSEQDVSVQYHLRVHDAEHKTQLSDRFNTVMTVHPGETTVSIPIDRIRDSPKGRKMDLTQVESIIFFLHQPTDPVTLYFDEFRLEK